jgi:hypothetical protein
VSRLRATATLIVATAVAGCATTAPTVAQLQTAEYGEPPQTYEGVIHSYFDASLKDPASIQYKDLTAPEKGYTQHDRGLIGGGVKITYGWLVKATVNAKNSYGGYVGFRTYTFLFRGDQVVDMIVPAAE